MNSDSLLANNSQDMNNSGVSITSGVSPVLLQQRKILALMQLDIWVQRQRPTQFVDYYDFAKNMHNISSHNQQSTVANTERQTISESHNINGHISSELNISESLADKNPSSTSVMVSSSDEQDIEAATATEKLQVNAEKTNLNLASEDNLNSLRKNIDPVIEQVKSKVAEPISQSYVTINKAIQVASFELIAVYYHQWVIMIDAKILQNTQALQLWENLLNALALTPKYLKFPICTGIHDQDSANASIAGFVFSLAKNDHAKIAMLTPLPEGTSHQNVESVPYLTEMLADGQQKQRLWQLLQQYDGA